ncbi:MAG: hypothetical protein RSE39_08440 [Oscillospiraceae bacterium]
MAKGNKIGSLAFLDIIKGNIKFFIIDSAPATCIVNAINEIA